MTLEEEITSLLKRPDVIESGGMTMPEIQHRLNYPADGVRDAVYTLYDEGVLIGIPDKKDGRWYRKYYFPSIAEQTVLERLERIFTEIGIPPFIDVGVSRAGKTFLVGIYGRTPFSIVDYSSQPPIVFRDRRAGGKHDEIIYSKKRFRYICKRGTISKVYDHHGNPGR